MSLNIYKHLYIETKKIRKTPKVPFGNKKNIFMTLFLSIFEMSWVGHFYIKYYVWELSNEVLYDILPQGVSELPDI